jgi:hypothetical protein
VMFPFGAPYGATSACRPAQQKMLAVWPAVQNKAHISY